MSPSGRKQAFACFEFPPPVYANRHGHRRSPIFSPPHICMRRFSRIFPRRAPVCPQRLWAAQWDDPAEWGPGGRRGGCRFPPPRIYFHRRGGGSATQICFCTLLFSSMMHAKFASKTNFFVCFGSLCNLLCLFSHTSIFLLFFPICRWAPKVQFAPHGIPPQ